ncbi:hypothetical protein BGZ72_009117 [Mortierella alpina]|nr:hypothetical protein BGZ72_009117 [Mortierella alpina]
MLWFANCPRLQSLSWTVLKDEFGPIAKAGEQIVEGISSLALAGHLVRLHSVKLNFKSFMTPVDSLPLTLSLTKLLTSLKAPLQVLEIEYAQNMDATIFLPVLQCHFSTLRDLNINIDSSHTVQTLLTSCPLLEEFKGSKVRALDMMSGAPWSCLGLQHLQLMIELDPEMEDQPGMTKDDQQVFALRQISQLARMNRLDFSGRLSYGEGNVSRFRRPTLERYQQGNNLDLRLSKGLDLLCTLSRLQYVTLPCGQVWDDQEFDWALLHWPNLSNMWETVIPVWRLLPIPDGLDGFAGKVAAFRTVIQNK